VAAWPALRLWRGPSGLRRLADLAGTAQVQVMLSSDARGAFIGDMQHLKLLQTPLAPFLDGSLARELASTPGAPGALSLYLAQSPISAAAAAELGDGLQPGPLHALWQDVQLPEPLQGAQVSQINLWASPAATRSSLHYDPYNNLLCLVEGAKAVRVAPPSAAPHLRPQPAYHDSANHAAADLWDDAAAGAGGIRGLQEFELRPGDALFVPEGWWHQVQSGGGTLAVNFWWESPASARFGRHMDSYYLRRLAQSLAEQRRAEALDGALAAAPHEALNEAGQRYVERHGAPDPSPGHFLHLPDSAGAVERRLSGAEAAAVEALEAALAEGALGGSRPVPVAGAQSGGGPDEEVQRRVEDVLFAVAARGVEALMRVLLTLRERRAAAAAALLLRGATPAVWDLLTSWLERFAALLAGEGRGGGGGEELLAQFYDCLYEAVPDRAVLLEVMLRQKQRRGRWAMEQALAQALQL
jgi:hypothetical protein